jgi:hypothetical protein
MSNCVGCNGGGYYPNNSSVNCCICPDAFGCCKNLCPDFEIKRHDTQPSFNLAVSDCEGPLDLTNTVVEVSMWAKGKLKTAITSSTTEFSLADNIGFYQSLPGDIILVDRVRGPEMMLVIGHDEDANLIKVMRGYQGTSPGSYKRGTSLRLFRVLNGMGETKTVTETVDQIDGTKKDVLIESKLVYNWRPSDTCLPGCYYIEFKLLKMLLLETDANPYLPVPSVASIGPCDMGYGVEWVRRFPVDRDGFVIRVFNSPTAENIAT